MPCHGASLSSQNIASTYNIAVKLQWELTKFSSRNHEPLHAIQQIGHNATAMKWRETENAGRNSNNTRKWSSGDPIIFASFMIDRDKVFCDVQSLGKGKN